MTKKRSIVILLIFMILLSSISPSAAVSNKKVPKYVFMFIGDGLGSAQRQIAELYMQDELNDKSKKLYMNSLDVAGLNTTYSNDTLITDSAAAGTASATGHKTNNGYISVDENNNKLTTIVEELEKKEVATGLITTTRLTHATPAAFASHNISRNDEIGIAEDFLESGVDFFAGGGVRYFIPQNGEYDDKYIVKSKRKDDKNLLEEFKKKGYKVFSGEKGNKDFNNFKVNGEQKVFAALTYSHMPYEVDRINEKMIVPSLAEMTKKGIEVLSKYNKGFFMMVEGGRIDHACHANDATGSIMDTIAFDNAIKEAKEFYDKYPDETLILVVGDHETGGLGLGFGTNYFMNIEPLKKAKISVADVLCRAYDGNRDSLYKLLDTKMGLKDLNEKEKKMLEIAMDKMDSDKKIEKAEYGGYAPVAIAATHIISERANINWTTYAHSGTSIPLSAMGIGAEEFGGFKDNTEIAKVLADLLKVKLTK